MRFIRETAICTVLFLGFALSFAGAQVLGGTSGEAICLGLGIDAKYDDAFSSREWIRGDFQVPWMDVVAALSVNNDQKYGADIANLPDGTFLGNYFLMDEGGIRLKASALALEAGRFAQRDTIDSPYSLFLNGNGLAAIGSRIAYDGDLFMYESRWIDLNERNAMKTTAWPKGYPDRGANIKTYALKLGGGMRVGFQDAAVYTGRSFDFEYFLNPIPQYFIQYVKGTVGRPWTTDSNENDIIGFFWDWKTEKADYFAQTLIDDFNMHFLLPDTPNNPWKAAWSLGARFKTNYGTVGLYQAGATKYTFEPIAIDMNAPEKDAYGYTYYPDTQFSIDGGYYPIAMADNMIGYRNGENNLAFMVDWRGEALGFGFYSSMEYVVSGAQSPANPWQDLFNAVDYSGTSVIADERLEHKILGTIEARRDFKPISLFCRITLGEIFNVSKLTAPTGVNPNTSFTIDDILIFKPSTENRFVFTATLGGSIALDVSGMIAAHRAKAGER